MELLVLLCFAGWISLFSLSVFLIVQSSSSTSSQKLAAPGNHILTRYQYAEMQVAARLCELDPKMYAVFNNIVLPSKKGSPYTEIDHVVYSPFAVFCIEVKSHSGNIYGYSDSLEWRQYIGKSCYSFMSPIRQNYKHTQAIRHALGLDYDIPVISVIIFPNANKVMVDNCIADYSIENALRTIPTYNKPLLSQNQCTMHIQTLRRFDSIKAESLARHIYTLEGTTGIVGV